MFSSLNKELYTITGDNIENITQRVQVLKYLKNGLLSRLSVKMADIKKNDIGRIFLSCVPIKDHDFVELDGRVLNKSNYPDLYDLFFPLLANFTSHESDKENLKKHYEGTIPTNDQGVITLPSGDFYVPDMYDRSLKYGNSSGVANDWKIDPSLISSFDLSEQIALLKNIKDEKDYTNKDNPESYAFTKSGHDVFITKKTKNINIKPNQYTLGVVNQSPKVLFNSRRIYFYTRAFVHKIYRGVENY